MTRNGDAAVVHAHVPFSEWRECAHMLHGYSFCVYIRLLGHVGHPTIASNCHQDGGSDPGDA